MDRESTIDWPSEGVQSSNINSCSNRTIAFFWNKFPKGHPFRCEREIHQDNPEVLDVGN